ncbi:MAG: transglutaminase-like domain-containing protein [Pirellulales bacterium]
MPAYCQRAAYEAFAQQIPCIDTTPGLFRAAFAIARHELPAAEVAPAEATIAQLARTVEQRVRSQNLDAKLAHLHDVLFDVVRFTGNGQDYYNPANSYLPEVLRTKRGLPITLVLIYKAVAEQLGLEVQGINSPGHFLAAVRQTTRGNSNDTAYERWMYVDPFYGGELLTRQDVFHRIADATGQPLTANDKWLTPATHRQWLGRMLNNLQAIFAHTGRERDLFAMQELQQLLT